MKLKTTSILMAGALFGAAVMPAQANNEAMMDLLKVLRDKGTISAEDYSMLANASKADKEAAEAQANEVKKQVKEATADMPKITTKGKIKVTSADGNWSFQPIGRVMWDFVDTDDSTENGTTAIDDKHGTELRRARLGFQGSIYNWGYKFEGDFATGSASIKDAYVSYGTKIGDNKFGLKLGQSHVPFGLNTKISSKYMSFMDRPWFADSEISPPRESGVVASLAAKDYRWTASAGYTIGELSSGKTSETDLGETMAARVSFVPYMADKKHLLQVGAGYLNLSGGDEFSYSQRLVSHIDAKKPLSTTVANFDGANAYTFDALGIFGSFHAMAEYLDYSVDGGANDDVDIDGYAVEAGYFLTGESLKWKKGYTSGITPKSSSGAWQIAARMETLNIDDNANGDDKADKWTVGINYYPTQNTRLMLNYDKVTDLEVNGTDSNFEPSALKFRAQAYW